MTISFLTLLTDCLVALGDTMGSTWTRIGVMDQWCIEAIRSFPILRPMFDDHTNGASVVYSVQMPTDFRQLISVEYPINQAPPVYLMRKNRLDPEFYNQAGYYDIDHDYTTGSGWSMYISGGVAALAHIKSQYLANHNTAMTDVGTCYLSVPDEYYSILITSVMCRAYRERLSFMMQDPTAHMTVITQLTEMVQHIEDLFQSQVAAAQSRMANSIVSPRLSGDKFDRVY
jgi:hypothetical protein